MQHIKPFHSIDVSLPGFQRCLRKSTQRAEFEAVLIDLLSDPIPGALGFKKLKGYKNPALYSVMVGGNHAYPRWPLQIPPPLATQTPPGRTC